MKRWALAAMAATMVVTAAPARAAEPIRIGALFAVTGTASFLGEPQKRTVEMLVEELNKAGGVNGRPVELFLYDTESDQSKAVLAFKRLTKRDQVSVVIGPSTSGESIAIAGPAEEAKVAVISCGASYKIVEPVEQKKWIFKVAHSDSHVAERLFAFMKQKGMTKVGIMTESTAYGASGREELVRLAPKFGLAIVADERFGTKDTDLTPQLTKIREAGAQAIVNWSIGPTQVLAVKNWESLGMKNILLFQSQGFANKKNLELAGSAAEGVMVGLGRVNVGALLPDSNPQKAGIMAYTKAYEEKFHEPISTFGGHAWDAFQVAVAAVKKAGTDPEKVRDAIENTKNFVGMHGVFNFSPTDHNGLSPDDLEVVKVSGGNWVLAK